jgi:hypothetical protein
MNFLFTRKAQVKISAASCEASIKPTHPLIPSLEREGKPSKARRGELKPKQSFEEFYRLFSS